MGFEDIWDQDRAWEQAVGPGIPVPNGFRLHSVSARLGWHYRIGDLQRGRVSLSATGNDISGLADIPINGVWRLEFRYRDITDDDFDLIARFDTLEELDVTHTRISDRSARRMHTLQQLRVLILGSCAITDAAMEHIAALRRLEQLDLFKTRVTDDGLRALAFHPTLRILNLRDTKVTGERLAPLVTIPTLRQVSLNRRQHRRADRFAHERPEVDLFS